MNTVSLVSIFSLALALGMKHATEPDHVIAVSTVASHSKKVISATLAGVFWGIGHTATLFGMGMVLILLKNQITEAWALSLEFVVGIMLVYLGVSNLRNARKLKKHHHPVKGTHISYFLRSMFIGVVHGLAGSGAMVLLTMSTVNNFLQGALYILIFGLGTVIGMLILSTLIGLPFVLSSRRTNFHSQLTKVTSAISVVFGLYYMYSVGIGERLFQIWF